MDGKMKATVHKRDRMRWRQKPVQGRRKYEATVILEKKTESFSILESHSARREVTAFQRCLHSFPVCREHPEDTVGRQKTCCYE